MSAEVENGHVSSSAEIPSKRIAQTKKQRLNQYRRQLTNQISSQFPANAPLPIWILAVIFIGIGLVFMISLLSLFSFPDGVSKENERRFPTRFNADNAYEHIRYLSVDIGPRVTGTVYNEELAVNYLLGQINDIIAHKSPDVDIEVRHEQVAGFINRETRFYRSMVTYRGIQNIVVKLSSKDTNSSLNYILLNSHWDSVPLSPGAGDDVTMVAIMLELLRIFSRWPYLEHPVVFLFNGAEEGGLVGSHGFIHQNEWAKKVGVLLNLEVTGGGGKELLFQARSEHPWLMETYRDSVKNPFTTTVAQEIYEGGLIQSDTDYTMFKNFYDKLPAMDFAHAYDCYTYHTRFDDIHTIRKGSLQHTGDNMVDLIKSLDARSEIDNYLDAVNEKGDNVFYDYLGAFLVFYGQLTGTILNSVIFVIVTAITAWCAYSIKKNQGLDFKTVSLEYLIALVIQLVSVGAAIGVTIFIAWGLDACNRSMIWYTHTWLIFGIYVVPFFAISGGIPYLYIKFRERRGNEISTSYYVQMALHSHCNLLSIVLIILTIMGINSAYMILLSTMFYFFSTIINVLFNFVNKGNKWLYLHCIAQVFPTLYYFYLLIQLLMGMIPIGARAYDGALRNPENTIALIVAFFTILSTGFYAPIFMMFKHRKWILSFMGGIFVVFLIMAFTPLGFPYQERQPQRFVAWHTYREFFDHTGSLRYNDSGYYLHGSDRHGARTLFDHVPGLQDSGLTALDTDDCDQFVMCGQPWWRISYNRNRDYSYYIKAEAPPLPQVLPALTLTGLTNIDATRRRLDFSLAGVFLMNLEISPMKDTRIVEWSFLDRIPKANTWNDRDYYFVTYMHGVKDFYMRDLDFWMIIERPESYSEPYLIDIALSALFIDDESTKSQGFVDFMGSFPTWTNVQNWTAYHVGYQF